MDPTLNLVLGLGLTLLMVIAFAFIWRRKPGQSVRSRSDEVDLE